MSEEQDRAQALLSRLKVMNFINSDDNAFDGQLKELVSQAEADLSMIGITYDKVISKNAYDNAVIAYTNMFFNNDDKSNRDFLKEHYDQLVIDLIGEVRLT